MQVGARSEQASDLDPAARLLGREAQGSGGPGLGRVAVAAIGALACVDLTVDPCRRRVECPSGRLEGDGEVLEAIVADLIGAGRSGGQVPCSVDDVPEIGLQHRSG